MVRDFPGFPVIELHPRLLPNPKETVCFQRMGHGFNLDQGTKISQTAQHGQEQRTKTTKVTANNRNKDAGCRPKEDPGPLVVELASGAGGGGAGLPDLVLASW